MAYLGRHNHNRIDDDSYVVPNVLNQIQIWRIKSMNVYFFFALSDIWFGTTAARRSNQCRAFAVRLDWHGRAQYRDEPNSVVPNLIDAYVEPFMCQIETIRFGTWKRRHMNCALINQIWKNKISSPSAASSTEQVKYAPHFWFSNWISRASNVMHKLLWLPRPCQAGWRPIEPGRSNANPLNSTYVNQSAALKIFSSLPCFCSLRCHGYLKSHSWKLEIPLLRWNTTALSQTNCRIFLGHMINQVRLFNAGFLEGAESDQIVDAEETKLRQAMEEEKARWKDE